MSHFTVLVIGDDVEGQLAPFHEYECTGDDDQYVIDVDRTEEFRLEYQEATNERLRGPDGTLYSFFDEHGEWIPAFSQPEPDDMFKQACRTYFVPEGYTRVTLPATETETFEEFIDGWAGLKAVPYGQQPDRLKTHKFGFVELNARGEVVRAIDRTNPNKKWDWYQIGGRWSGYFTVKAGAYAVLGTRSLLDKSPDSREGKADQVRKGDIDFAAMRHAKATKAADEWDRYHAILDQHPPLIPWKTILDQDGNSDASRQRYWGQAAMKALTAAKLDTWEVDPLLVPRDQYIDGCAASAGVPFAVIKDGQWYERGSMGWWGAVSDEKDRDEWGLKVKELLESVPDDTLLTIVDCHI